MKVLEIECLHLYN